jgi:PhoH-like ATPase
MNDESMSIKFFVLDTNVLLQDQRALLRFSGADTEVIIPIYVLEELDGFKAELSDRGQRAREVTRVLDGLRELGSLAHGVPLHDGGILRVMQTEIEPSDRLEQSLCYDQLILNCALELTQSHSAEHSARVTLVTKDTNLRVRANFVGVHAIDYDPDKESEAHATSATQRATLDLVGLPSVRSIEYTLDPIKNGGLIEDLSLADSPQQEGLEPPPVDCRPNEALWAYRAPSPLIDPALSTPPRTHTPPLTHPEASPRVLICLDPEMKRWVRPSASKAWGLSALNEEQRLALHYLRAPEIPLVTLAGKAGTGKTLLALAAGLAQVVEEERYERVLVSRAIFPLGKDIGYLPGTLEEKMDPWLQPIYDNLDFLLGQRAQRQPHRRRAQSEELLEMGYIDVEPITYIRGRSIPRQYLIIDEAQNLTAHEVKTLLTRAGEGTKIVLIGDPQQVDHPYLDPAHNGLSYVARRFFGQECAAHVTLISGERSGLAALAADLL